jgi:thiamine-phosphate pyrophosphorylase
MLANQLKGIYAVTDDILTPLDTIEKNVEEALKAGVKIIQFRNKIHTDIEIEQIAINLQKLCSKYDALFVMNDRVELTGKLKLDAVHIGIEDISLIEARKIVGKNCLIGVSCYGNIELAKKATLQGADYVAFGACFSSPTKPQNKTIDKTLISLAKSILDIPVCVIGGITEHNINELKEHKPDMYAIVSAIFKGDITQNIIKIKQVLNK